MAMTLSGKPKDSCLDNCRCQDLTFHKSIVFANDECFVSYTNIICEHEKVCEMWQKKLKERSDIYVQSSNS